MSKPTNGLKLRQWQRCVVGLAFIALGQGCSSQSASQSASLAPNIGASVTAEGLLSHYQSALASGSIEAQLGQLNAQSWTQFDQSRISADRDGVAINGSILTAVSPAADAASLRLTKRAYALSPFKNLGAAFASVAVTANSDITTDDIAHALTVYKKLSQPLAVVTDADKASVAKLFLASLALHAASATHTGNLELSGASDFFGGVGDFFNCTFTHSASACGSNSPYAQCPVYYNRGYEPILNKGTGNTTTEIDTIVNPQGKSCKVKDPFGGAGANADACDQQLQFDTHPTEQANKQNGIPHDQQVQIDIACS